MISIINNRKGYNSLYHYAHFVCDCLYPEVINEIYKHEKVIRLKTIRQTLGNFNKMYENIMQVKSIEIPEEEFALLKVKPVILEPKETYRDKQSIEKFRNYIFTRYTINPTVYLTHYPEIILIKRGSRVELIDDKELQKLNRNTTTGSERREIKEIEKIQEYLANTYTTKFQAVYLEGKTFEEQVKLFNNAKMIVLAHGAAMSNMFFCKKGTTVVEITCCSNFLFFGVIARNIQLNHIRIDVNEPEHIIQILSNLPKN
jgi:hypothetical protein